MWAETNSILIQWDGRPAVLNFLNDVTERKQMKESLQEGEQQLHRIIDGSPIPAFVIGKNHLITHWNKALEEMSGIKYEQILGTNQHWMAFYGEERPCMADLLVDETTELASNWYTGKYLKSPLIKDGYEATDFFPDLGKEGKWLRFTAAAIRDSKGVIVAAIETLEDVTERKRAEEALQESEEKYRTILNDIEDGYYEVDLTGNFTFVNPSMSRILGYSQEEIIGMNNRQVMDKETAKRIFHVFNKVYENGVPTKYVDWEVTRRDGTEAVIGCSISLIRDAVKNPVGFRGVVRDITENKQAEKALQESELRFRLAAESSADLIWEWDIITGELKWFGPIDELLGYEASWFPRTIDAWESVIHHDDHDRVMAKLDQHLKDGTPYFEEYRVLQKDGTILYWTDCGTSVRNQENKPYKMIGAVTDVTELKRAEEKLKASEMQLRNLVESVPIGICIFAGPIIRYLNPVCEKITGYTRDELYMLDVWDIVHPEFKDTVREYVRKQQRGEPVTEIPVLKIVTKSGEERWVETSRVAIELEGEPLALVTMTDITERKLAEEALIKSEEKYRALLEDAGDAIVLAGEHGNILEVNKKAEELLGYTRDELLLMNYIQLHPTTELNRAIEAFKKIVRQGYGTLRDGSIYRKDGKVVPVDITGSVIQYAGMKVLQGSFRDISAQKQAKDALEVLVSKRTAELSAKNEQLIKKVREHKKDKAALRKKTNELQLNSNKLTELNAALKVLLKQREEDKMELEEKVMGNIKDLIFPYLEELKKGRLDNKSKMQVGILEANLNNIISPFTHRLSSKYSGFTPREIQVANFIR